MQQILTWLEMNEALVYGMVFSYCALKSGALPFLAAALAPQAALDPYLIGGAAFLGGYLGDELRFAVARKYGEGLVTRFPKLSKPMEATRRLIDRYGVTYIFMYRYPKGMRTIGALPVGLTPMPWFQFTMLNAASALLWASILVGCGYFLGVQLAETIAAGWGAASMTLLLLFILTAVLLFRHTQTRI
ncbi:DedA family protein [Sneathiella aquimaris]|uniref:DedA family protein n=1 Tax=Sneathiella aquimaris TaxID=2599305 RepID=UPI001469A39D|nr:VTT domain-containing protein [Sneathiella aquimaris]